MAALKRQQSLGAARWVTSAINRWLDQRKEDAQESAKVVAILNAHPDDADIRHRIGEASKSLQSLMDDYRGSREAQAPGQTMHLGSTYLVSRVLNNLNNFVALPRPEVPLTRIGRPSSVNPNAGSRCCRRCLRPDRNGEVLLGMGGGNSTELATAGTRAEPFWHS
jgi:hypothetical protein